MSTIGPPRSPKISEVIARQLAERIIDGQLEEGARLPPEREMAESLGVGRATLREALRLLETRGVIAMRMGPGGGPVVRQPRAENLSESLTLILHAHGAVLQDVIDARETLECMNVGRVAELITDDQLEELADSVRQTRLQLDDIEGFLRETQRFHRILNQAAPNVVLQIFNRALYAVTHAMVGEMPHTREHRRNVAAAHEKVLERLRERDKEGAMEAMRSHVRSSGAYWNEMAGDSRRKPVRWIQLDGRPRG